MKTFFTQKPKSNGQFRVDKFGENLTPVSGDYLWELGHEPILESAGTALYLSADDSLDIGIDVTIFYLDENYEVQSILATTDASDGQTFVEVLDGVTAKATFAPRAYVDDDSVVLNGNLYISKDNTDAGGNGIPDTITDVKGYIPQAHNQTMQTWFAVPAGYRAQIEGWFASIAKAGGVAGTLGLSLKVKLWGKSWRTQEMGGARSDGNAQIDRDWNVTRDWPAKTLIAIKIESNSTTDLEVYGMINGYFEAI